MSGIILFIMMLAQVTAPQEYTTKPGDSISVTVWERQSLSGTVIVDPSGNITLPMPVGVISVVGLTSRQISDALLKRLEEYMVNPSIFVSIIPSEGFNVHVLGEVKDPNFIKVPYNTTMQEAISRAGGFTPLSDKKNVLLIRKEENKTKEINLNFEKFIENGDRSANPILMADDILIVSRIPKSERFKYVNVIGAVIKPGVIDLEEPLPLIEILALAGGSADNAILSDISISNTSDNYNSWKHIDLESFLNGKDTTANPIILPGTVVYIPKEPKEKRPFSINVVGQVANPGSYMMEDDSKVFDAIYKAGGFVDEAAINKLNIIHSNSQSKEEEPVNIIEYLISGDEKHNPRLVKGDIIFVPMLEGAKKIPSIHTAFFPTMRISIIGEVAKPDIYQVSTDASMLDVLKIAGGNTSLADLKGVTIIHETPGQQQRFRVNLKKVLTEGDFHLLPKLKDGDTIFVPLKSESLWRSFVGLVADISIIAVAYLTLTGLR
jgi:protein involved in polysaccharide export with SLBB domain